MENIKENPEALVDPVAEGSPEQAGIAQTEMKDEQPQEATQTNLTTISSVSEPVLKKQVIYSGVDLESLLVVLAYLKVNRAINVEAVKKKINSIKQAGGIITPTMLVPARTCLDEGLEVVLKDGTPITYDTENLDLIYVIIDGQHRQDAVEKISKDAKAGEATFTNFYFIPLNDNYHVGDLLRESNVATYPWKDQQYLSNLIMMRDGNTAIKLDFLKEILAHPEAKTKAMVHWLSLDKGRNLYSRDIIAASIDNTKLKEIANVNEDRFNGGKRLYEVLSKRFASKEPGKTVYPDWVIDQISDETKATFEEMVNYIEQFFNSLTSSQIVELKDVKGSKSPYESRDSKVQALLTKFYLAYKTKHPIGSSK